MLGSSSWPTVSGGNLLDDRGSRWTAAALARAFVPMAMRLRPWLNSSGPTLRSVAARQKATGGRAGRVMPIWQCGSGLSVRIARRRRERSPRGLLQAGQQSMLRRSCRTSLGFHSVKSPDFRRCPAILRGFAVVPLRMRQAAARARPQVVAAEHRCRATGSNLRFLNSAITAITFSLGQTH